MGTVTGPKIDYELRSPSSASDWAEYHRIRQAVLWEARGHRDYNANHPDDLVPQNLPLLLLYRGSAVGVARLDFQSDGIGVIRRMAIDIGLQRQGHGRTLLNLLEQRAHGLGMIILEVNSAEDAVAFYQKLGYAVWRETNTLRKFIDVSMTSDSMTVGEVLRAQNTAHGLPADGGETDRWFCVHIGRFTIRLPNPPARQRAVFFHDTNHLLTGYDTVFSRGEMEIAAWEVASGCGRYWFAWLINLDMFALGLAVCPRALFRAFVRGRRIATSMYCRFENRSTLAEMTVADLRASIGLDQCPVASLPADSIAFVLWAGLAVMAILAPVLAVLLVFLAARRH
jgi:N-acetylglutamate synthase-like GNAT family acetyltransferase